MEPTTTETHSWLPGRVHLQPSFMPLPDLRQGPNATGGFSGRSEPPRNSVATTRTPSGETAGQEELLEFCRGKSV